MDQPEQKKKEEPEQKKEQPRIIISELDKTLIKLQELFQNNDILICLNLKLTEDGGKFTRSFQILDCASLTDMGTTSFKRPEYFG